MTHTQNARRLAAIVASVLFLAGVQSAPRAADTLTLTFPSRLAAGPDFATDVLKDPWDFSNAEDVGFEPSETINWSNFSVNSLAHPGLAGGTTTTADAQLSLLYSGFYTIINP